jgi:hypothetical protein
MGSKAEKRTVPRGGKKSSNKMDRAIRVQYGVLPYRFTETNSLEVLTLDHSQGLAHQRTKAAEVRSTRSL